VVLHLELRQVHFDGNGQPSLGSHDGIVEILVTLVVEARIQLNPMSQWFIHGKVQGRHDVMRWNGMGCDGWISDNDMILRQ
jgi:hypothetical protein